MVYLVESYLPSAEPAGLEGVTRRVRASVDALAREGVRLRHVRSILVPEDGMCISFYEADSPLAVSEASRRAGLPCDRVVEAIEGRST
jgi:hypothetical protein